MLINKGFIVVRRLWNNFTDFNGRELRISYIIIYIFIKTVHYTHAVMLQLNDVHKGL